MLRTLVRGLLGRLLAYGALVLGFWLLYKGFMWANYALATLGGAVILGGMYLMVAARRGAAALPTVDFTGSEEDSSGDSLDRGGEGDKLPP